MNLEETLRHNIGEVEERLQAACRRSGRSRSEITLVAVTKTVTASVASLLPGLGLDHLGENRPQSLWQKAPLLPASVHWHFIGHLQRNKIEKTLPLVYLIQSVDSLRLLLALDQEAARQGRVVPVLLEINASREPQKHGFAIEEIPTLVPHLADLGHIRVQGLMTMAALEAEPEKCRPTFAELRRLRQRWHKEFPAPHSLDHLSMGMSNDFEIAVEEGATLVRLGTVLFHGLTGEE